MNIITMHNCCGCYLITNFGHTLTNAKDLDRKYNPTIKEVDIYLKGVITSNKMLVAYINDQQYKKIGKALTDNGFKRTATHYHPQHNSLIYQYTRAVNKK